MTTITTTIAIVIKIASRFGVPVGSAGTSGHAGATGGLGGCLLWQRFFVYSRKPIERRGLRLARFVLLGFRTFLHVVVAPNHLTKALVLQRRKTSGFGSLARLKVAYCFADGALDAPKQTISNGKFGDRGPGDRRQPEVLGLDQDAVNVQRPRDLHGVASVLDPEWGRTVFDPGFARLHKVVHHKKHELVAV